MPIIYNYLKRSGTPSHTPSPSVTDCSAHVESLLGDARKPRERPESEPTEGETDLLLAPLPEPAPKITKIIPKKKRGDR